jgi:hypothetical protein
MNELNLSVYDFKNEDYDDAPVFRKEWDNDLTAQPIQDIKLDKLFLEVAKKAALLRELLESENAWIKGEVGDYECCNTEERIVLLTHDPHLAAKHRFEDVYLPTHDNLFEVQWEEDGAAILIAIEGERFRTRFWQDETESDETAE